MEVESNPAMGKDVNTNLCPGLHGYTDTLAFNSILSITERGSYNTGIDPVNIWLSLTPSSMCLT